MGISIARVRQIVTVFLYNILSPNKILGVPGPKNFRMPWIMTQEQIYQKNFLAKCDFRRRVSMGAQPPCPLLLWGTWKYFSNMSCFGRDYSLFFTVSLLVYFSCSTMGYSKKKKNWGHTSSLRNPLKFLAILLTFSCSGKVFIPGISVMQSCISYTPWKFQNQKPRPLEILFFFLKPPEIPRLF